ncbi:MAG: dioxygenase [Ignavibacteriae bacterium]|nr:dioxygenase [Ignavibacteriota bacterium]
MTMAVGSRLAPVLSIPHGGGPLPLMGDPGHQTMVDFLTRVPRELPRPEAILVISAHWEEMAPTVTSGAAPGLIYDYYGFPEESYHIQYPAPGQPALAHEIVRLLGVKQIECRPDGERGFDHGMFVPLKLMYPRADIPVVQLSLVEGLDPALHLAVGSALAPLRGQNVMILGSGFSFHNLRAFFSTGADAMDPGNEAFQNWVVQTCNSAAMTTEQRASALVHWEDAPSARYCHPREEHLLPLHVCAGAASGPAHIAFDDRILGKRAIGLLWQ